MIGKRMLIDTSKCTACRACQVSCKQWHSLPAEDTTFTGTYTNPPDNSGANLTVVKFTEAEVGGKLRFLFFNNRCRHCQRPSCKGSCPLGAIVRQANGIVRIDPDICQPDVCSSIEKKPCQWGCPFAYIPQRRYTLNGSDVATKMRKCDFCFNRFTDAKLKLPPFKSADGKTKSALPACQVTCPPGAITSGVADAILTKANKRVAFLRLNGYPNARVYPTQRSWPSHVIWILLEPKEVYGLV